MPEHPVMAFDWYRSLEINLHLREIAREAKRRGCKVYIIAAIPDDVLMEYDLWCREHHVHVDGIIAIRHRRGDESSVPLRKVVAMLDVGATVLFDDNDRNLAAVRDAGFVGVKVDGTDPPDWRWDDA